MLKEMLESTSRSEADAHNVRKSFEDVQEAQCVQA